MKTWWNNIFYSFPVQLFLLHLRNHLLLIIIWIILGALITGQLANSLGIKYLFWAPEYLGEVNIWSFFFLGFSFAGLCMTWNLTSYMLDAFRFPFLASLKRPFTKFCINNFLIPLFFLILLLTCHIRFELSEDSFVWWKTLYNCIGFLIGIGVLLIVITIYFELTNKDIFSYQRAFKKRPPNLIRTIAPGERVEVEAIRSERYSWRVDTYLSASFHPRMVRSVAHYDTQILLNVFRQNHTNAFIIQLISLVVLISLGMLIEQPLFLIPAGASVFLFVSVLMAIMGAIIYWFHRWSVLVFLVLFLGLNQLTKQGWFNHENRAYGMNYNNERPNYDFETLQTTSDNLELRTKDSLNTIKILENWRQKTGEAKPKMLFVCASGGGHKASTWTTQVLSKVDSATQGELMRHSAVMTGASGGMLGLAYFRELYLQQQLGQINNLYHGQYLRNISKDMLNSLAFTIVSNDLFFPWRKFKIGDDTYLKDRGYIFERQLNENTNYVLDKRLGDYYMPEQTAQIPMLFITPSIINDARRLIISPQGASYMTIAPIGIQHKNIADVDAIDFQSFFANQRPDSLRFTTALRMSATYPYILPSVTLPTRPDVEVVDAGFRDNIGLKSVTRFIQVFRTWIQENTSGAVVVVIRGVKRESREIEATDHDGIIEAILDPLGIASKVISVQDFENDTNLGLIHDLLGEDKFEVIRFYYTRSLHHEQASMTLRLTDNERKDILYSIEQSHNQASIRQLQDILDVAVD